jgi:hypothetical protein
MLEKYSLEDMLQYKNLVGDISQQFGSPKIENMIPMLLSKSKKVLLIILKQPLMKLRF